jgi:hypothetical protein
MDVGIRSFRFVVYILQLKLTRIPKRTFTSIIVFIHAELVVPAEVLRAAFVKRGKEPKQGVCVH